MTPRVIIERYYELANAGKWTAWCDLFADGHDHGRTTCRPN